VGVTPISVACARTDLSCTRHCFSDGAVWYRDRLPLIGGDVSFVELDRHDGKGPRPWPRSVRRREVAIVQIDIASALSRELRPVRREDLIEARDEGPLFDPFAS
jgi:hypothetical protein